MVHIPTHPATALAGGAREECDRGLRTIASGADRAVAEISPSVMHSHDLETLCCGLALELDRHMGFAFVDIYFAIRKLRKYWSRG